MKLSPEILAEIERLNARIRFRAPSEGGAGPAPAPPPPTDPPAERKPRREPPDATPALAADILEEIERLQKRIRFRDPSKGGAGFVIPPPPAPPAEPKSGRTPSRPTPSPSPSLDLFEIIEREHARLRELRKRTQGADPGRQVPPPPSPKLRPPGPSAAAPAASRRRRSFAPRTRLDRAMARMHGLSKRPPKTPPPA